MMNEQQLSAWMDEVKSAQLRLVELSAQHPEGIEVHITLTARSLFAVTYSQLTAAELSLLVNQCIESYLIEPYYHLPPDSGIREQFDQLKSP